MQRTYVLLTTLILSISLSAQSFKIPIGKKMQAVSNSKMTMQMSAMGQDVTVETENGNKSEYEFKAVTPNGYTMTSRVKSIKTKTNTMGTEMVIDSENEDDRKNPAYAEVFKMIDAPNEIVVENNKTTMNGAVADKLSQMGNIMDNLMDMTRFFLTDKYITKLNPGNQWTDSLIGKETSIVNEYTVEKNDENGIALNVKTLLKINTTITQSGMEAKTDLHGTIIGHRLYNKTTGVLHTDDSDADLTGNIEVMQQAMPVHMKMRTTTVID